MRDITLEDTIYIKFTTRSFATGAPTTLAGTPVLSIYEENNLTQITAGVSVSVDYDGVTGLNQATIVATAANGYENGKSYDLVITTGTVGGVTVVGEVVGSFTIGSSAAAVDLANATDGLGALKTLIDTLTTNVATVDTVVDGIQTDLDNATDGLGALKILIDTVNTDLSNGTDGLGALKTLIDTVNTDLSNGTDGLGALKALLDSILIDTGTTLENHLTDIKGGTFSGATDSLEAIRDRGDAAWTTGAGGSDRLLMVDTTIATLASQTSFTLSAGSADDNAYNNCTIVIEDASTSTQKAVGIISAYTGVSKTVTLKYDPAIFTMAVTDKVYILAENALKSTLANRQLNVAADGDIAGDIDGNVVGSVGSLVGHTVQTGDNFARIGVAGAGLTDLGGMSTAMKAQVNVEADTALTDYDPPTRAELTSDKNEIIADLDDVKGTAFVKDTHSLKQILDDVTGLNGDAMRGTDGANTVVPDAAGTAPTVAEITADINSNLNKTGFSLSAAGTLAIWHEALTNIITAGTIGKLLKDEITSARMTVLTDWINGGRLDLILDELTTQGDTNQTAINGIQTDLDNATDGLGALKILIDAIQTDLDNGVDGLGALKTLIDGLNNISAADILTTALTEAYAVDGAAATLSELLYMIWSILNSLKFVSTTGTSRKLDGATTAMTFTIDDANNPTDINRAT